MAGMKFSQLEAKFTGDEDVGYTPKVRLRRFPHTFTSPSLIAAFAFCVGVWQHLETSGYSKTLGSATWTG